MCMYKYIRACAREALSFRSFVNDGAAFLDILGDFQKMGIFQKTLILQGILQSDSYFRLIRGSLLLHSFLAYAIINI